MIVIETKEQLIQLSEDLKALESKHIALDFETTGLNPYRGDKPFLLALAISAEEYVIPIHFPRETGKLLKQILTDEGVSLRGFNIKFDLHFCLSYFGIKPKDIRCKLVDSQVLARLHKNDSLSLSLGEVASWFGYAKDDRVNDFIVANKCYKLDHAGAKVKDFTMVPAPLLYEYAAKDARLHYDLVDKLQKSLMDLNTYLSTLSGDKNIGTLISLESEVTKVLLGMEAEGVILDETFTEAARSFEAGRVREFEHQYTQITGTTLVDSSKALSGVFEQYPDIIGRIPVTEKGNRSFTDEVLSGIEHPVAECVRGYREANKKVSTYYENFKTLRGFDGRIHPNFRQSGTQTGRLSCIQEDMLIQIPGGTKKIKDIEVGEYVYGYNKDGKITLKKVKAKYDNGVQRCVRATFISRGDGSKVFLECTPDHKVLTSDLKWESIGEVSIGTKVKHLRRGESSGRVRLYSSGKVQELEESVIKREFFNCPSFLHIHHIDGNSKNNSLDNLAVATSVGHNHIHAIVEGKNINVEKNTKKKSTKFSLLKELAKLKGRASLYRGDFASFKKRCYSFGIKVSDVRKRYSSKGVFLNKANMLHYSSYGSIEDCARAIGVGTTKFKSLCTKYSITYNHYLSAVEDIGVRRVFDLSVEEIENFIASEICVHNCSDPNLQNVPKEDDSEYSARGCFIAPAGYKWLSIDYQAQEFRLLLDHSEEMGVIKEVLAGKDVHQATADLVGCSRKEAKTINFGLLYGMGSEKLANSLEVSRFEADNIKEKYFRELPRISQFTKAITKKAETGKVSNWLGRVYLFNREYAYKAVNYVIQGGCSDIMRVALVRLHRYIQDNKLGTKIILSVHDEVCFYLRDGEEEHIKSFQKIMSEAYPSEHLPLTTEASIGVRWNQLEKIRG